VRALNDVVGRLSLAPQRDIEARAQELIAEEVTLQGKVQKTTQK
jgi:hypothetical protein